MFKKTRCTLSALTKIIFCYILCNIINHTAATAQLFHPKDSVRNQRVIQVGLGEYTGVNKVIPLPAITSPVYHLQKAE